MPSYLFCNRRENPFAIDEWVWDPVYESIEDEESQKSTEQIIDITESVEQPVERPARQPTKRRGRPRKYNTQEEAINAKREHARRSYLNRRPPRERETPTHLEDKYTKYECPQCCAYFEKPCYYNRNHKAYHFNKSVKHKIN
jgi:hypothetical protein